MALARIIDGKRYELLRSYKSKAEAESVAQRRRKLGMRARVIRQKQFINLRGDERVFWGVFARGNPKGGKG